MVVFLLLLLDIWWACFRKKLENPVQRKKGRKWNIVNQWMETKQEANPSIIYWISLRNESETKKKTALSWKTKTIGEREKERQIENNQIKWFLIAISCLCIGYFFLFFLAVEMKSEKMKELQSKRTMTTIRTK